MRKEAGVPTSRPEEHRMGSGRGAEDAGWI